MEEERKRISDFLAEQWQHREAGRALSLIKARRRLETLNTVIVDNFNSTDKLAKVVDDAHTVEKDVKNRHTNKKGNARNRGPSLPSRLPNNRGRDETVADGETMLAAIRNKLRVLNRMTNLAAQKQNMINSSSVKKTEK